MNKVNKLISVALSTLIVGASVLGSGSANAATKKAAPKTTPKTTVTAKANVVKTMKVGHYTLPTAMVLTVGKKPTCKIYKKGNQVYFALYGNMNTAIASVATAMKGSNLFKPDQVVAFSKKLTNVVKTKAKKANYPFGLATANITFSKNVLKFNLPDTVAYKVAKVQSTVTPSTPITNPTQKPVPVISASTDNIEMHLNTPKITDNMPQAKLVYQHGYWLPKYFIDFGSWRTDGNGKYFLELTLTNYAFDNQVAYNWQALNRALMRTGRYKASDLVAFNSFLEGSSKYPDSADPQPYTYAMGKDKVTTQAHDGVISIYLPHATK